MYSLFTQCYTLSLARRPDRRVEIEREDRRFGLTSTFIDAVDGLTVNKTDLIGKGIITATNRCITAVCACAATHHKVWKLIEDCSDPDDAWYLIREDDGRLNPALSNRPDIFRAYFAALPLDAGFVYVGCQEGTPDFLPRHSVPVNRLIAKVVKPVYGAHAYAVTKEFVRRRLHHLFPVEMAVDCFINKLGPQYAFINLDDRYWGTQTPSDFYVVPREADEETPFCYAGLSSCRQSHSDIQYGVKGLQRRLIHLVSLFKDERFEEVITEGGKIKGSLLKQISPTFYYMYLNYMLLAYYQVDRDTGRELCPTREELSRVRKDIKEAFEETLQLYG